VPPRPVAGDLYFFFTNISPIMIIIGYMKLKIFCRCTLFPSWSG